MKNSTPEPGRQIVHLGLGNFTRAHQAWYTAHANTLAGEDWRIIGVSLRRPDVANALKARDYRYTLEIEDEAGTDYEIIDVVKTILVAPHDPAAVVAVLSDEATKIVTLTVTEKGYALNPADGTLNLDDPGIRADLAGGPPQSTIGFLAAGLAERRRTGVEALTILSCDNLPDNGHALRAAVIGFAQELDQDLAAWIKSNVAFPCSMVDRIVPATTDDLRARVKAATGEDDAWPVATERYTEWVIEDNFAGPRPHWELPGGELVGAVFVENVRPYEFRKLRMLNGAHSTLAYAGLMAGKTYVHEAVADEALFALAQSVMNEAAETLPQSVAEDASAYGATLMRRFFNPGLAHSLIQIAMDGSQKLPIRILPSLIDRLNSGKTAPALETGIAAWLAFIMRTAKNNGTLNDPQSAALLAAGRAGGAEAANSLLAMSEIFGDFAEQYKASARRIATRAVEDFTL